MFLFFILGAKILKLNLPLINCINILYLEKKYNILHFLKIMAQLILTNPSHPLSLKKLLKKKFFNNYHILKK